MAGLLGNDDQLDAVAYTFGFRDGELSDEIADLRRQADAIRQRLDAEMDVAEARRALGLDPLPDQKADMKADVRTCYRAAAYDSRGVPVVEVSYDAGATWQRFDDSAPTPPERDPQAQPPRDEVIEAEFRRVY